MTSYSVLDARNQLSRLIGAAEAGEEVTITRHGRPVARIVPISYADLSTGAALLDFLQEVPRSASTGDELEERIAENRGAWE